MRLTEFERQVIRNAILLKDKDAKVFLFGSRADETKKGGDIDVLVNSSRMNFGDTPEICVRIFEKMEEQKIDFVFAKDLNENAFVRYIGKQETPF